MLYLDGGGGRDIFERFFKSQEIYAILSMHLWAISHNGLVLHYISGLSIGYLDKGMCKKFKYFGNDLELVVGVCW